MGCGGSKGTQPADQPPGMAPTNKSLPRKRRTSFRKEVDEREGRRNLEANRRRPPSHRRKSTLRPTAESTNTREKLPDDGERLMLQGNWELESGDETELHFLENSYPSPTPPKTNVYPSKMDFYMSDLKGLTAPPALDKNFSDLASYLTQEFPLGINKVRAILAWMSAQKIRTRHYGGDAKEGTPLGYMKAIKSGRGTFAGLFAMICRLVEIPCVIIKGTYKSSFHQVGEEDLEDSKSIWTAVHIDENWQLIHPYLVCTPLAQEPQGGPWTSLESNKAPSSKDGPTLRVFNEFFFVPKPEEYVYVCLPDEEFSAWQLLERPVDYQSFMKTAFLRPGFFQNDFKLKTEDSCILKAVGGKCLIQMKGVEETLRGLTVMYDLQSQDDVELDDGWGSLVLCGRNEDTWNVQVRFPITGDFKLSIFGIRADWGFWIADFKIVCETPLMNFKRQPSVSGEVGWGPNKLSADAGLLAPSHEGGIIFVKPKEEHVIKFILSKKVRIKHQFRQAGTPDEDLVKYAKKTPKNREVDFKVYIPDKGDYTLMLYVLDDNTREYKNVCNYLFTDTEINTVGKRREGVQQRKAREKLRQATVGQDIEEIDDSIDRFIKSKLEEEDDDLGRAKRRNKYLKLKRGLREGVMRRHEETLAKAIDEAHHSPYREVLQTNIDDANLLLEHLRKLDTHCHDVREMNQSTISELANYASPPKAVHETMIITFLLLGEDNKKLESWSHIQGLLHKQGRENIICRINNFTGDVDMATIKRAEALHNSVPESEVLSASVCASTFYQWTNNVLPELKNGTYEGNTSQNADDSYESDMDIEINFSNNATDDVTLQNDVSTKELPTESTIDDDYYSQEADDDTKSLKTNGHVTTADAGTAV